MNALRVNIVSAVAACMCAGVLACASAPALYAAETTEVATDVEIVRTTADFPDLNASEWYAPYVDYVVANNIINGYGDGRFDPNGTLTRGQIVTILWNMAGKPAVPASVAKFSDVDYTQYFGEPISWARTTGVVNGVGNNRFEPAATVTREQTAVMLANYAKYCGLSLETEGEAFYTTRDWHDSSAWAREALAWAVDQGIIGEYNEYAEGILTQPSATTSRIYAAKMVAVFHRDILTAAREAKVLEGLQAKLASNGAALKGWEIELADTEGSLERGYYLWAPVNMTYAELKVAFQNNSETRTTCTTVAESMNTMTASAAEYVAASGVDLPVYGIMATTDNVSVYVSKDGATQLSFDISLRR